MFYISETFNKNSSTACDCPKACDVVHFKSSTSYATSNQNGKSRFDVPGEFLKRTGKHLNDSLDTREYLEPDIRQANIQEAERVLRGLPSVTQEYFNHVNLWMTF